MTRRRRARAGRASRTTAFATTLALAATAACGTPPEQDGDEGGTRARLQRLLDRQAEAVADGDEDRYLGTIAAGAYRETQRQVFRNLRRLPLDEWSPRITSLTRPSKENSRTEAEARVELRYRLRTHDASPVVAEERLSFARGRNGWRATSELPGSDHQLWEQGRLTVVRGERSLVLGSGTTRARMETFVRAAERAVTAVSRGRPEEWPRRVVVEVPATLQQTARLLDAPASDYADIAAVTTGEAGTSVRAAADRIVVNPEAYGELSPTGQQVVLTHETVHVATRTETTDATPLWLSEGVADRIGYRGSGRTPEQIAPELARAVRDGRQPRELPADREFRFGSDPEAMGRAYAGGWLACRLIAEEWGEEQLSAFYRRVGDGGRDGRAAVDTALREVLGVDRDTFTERWRAYVRQQLS